jgi:hypothetical protein
MRLRIAIISSLVLSAGGFAALSLLRGQERPLASPPPAALPHEPVRTANTAETAVAHAQPPRDFSKLNDLQKEMLLSAQRGAEWLYRMNTVKGRFTPGLAPALQDVVLEEDHYLRQAGSAYALAHAARSFREDRYTARATQTILALLDDTTLDAKQSVRYTSMPSSVVNRLAAAGLLVLAINELPDPQADLLESSEQLCNYIRRQARPDGSLAYTDGKPAAEDADAVSYPGLALYALMGSQARRPAAWKIDMVRKAVGAYRPQWREHKNMESVPWMTAACTEAYLASKDQACADFVFEMNDWLCGLQYPLDAQHERTWGGFKGWSDGHSTETQPTISSACYAEGLIDACRTARQAVDLDRYRRYQGTLQMGLQFVTRLQYTEGNTSHFAEWYRSRLVGGFHASQQDGNLRIDTTQFAVSALLQFLDADLR